LNIKYLTDNSTVYSVDV